MLSQKTLLTVLNATIAPRSTNSNGKTSTANQMFLKTTNTPVFVPIVANVEAIIIVNLVCLAKDKKRNNCGIVSHFAKKCREPRKSQPQSSQSQQTKVKQITATSSKSDDEKPVNYITSYQQLYDHVYDSHYDSDSVTTYDLFNFLLILFLFKP